jgi:hypothetical protein
LQNVAIGKETLAAQGLPRLGAIKAGRRKLSRKKTGKAWLLSGKVPVHIPVIGRRGAPITACCSDFGVFYSLRCAATISGNLTLRAGARVSPVRDKTKVSARIYPGVKINGELAPNPLTVAKGKEFVFPDCVSSLRLDQVSPLR